MFATMEAVRVEELHLASDPQTGLRAIVAIHNTHLGPALGGCRYLAYADEDSAARDAPTGSTLSAPKQSAEPVLPSGGSSVSSQVPPAPVSEAPKVRLPTRRGSTGAINTISGEKATTSNAIPTFAPTGAAAPGTTTTAAAGSHASAAGTLSASNDPIFDFSQEYVVPEVNSKFFILRNELCCNLILTALLVHTLFIHDSNIVTSCCEF